MLNKDKIESDYNRYHIETSYSSTYHINEMMCSFFKGRCEYCYSDRQLEELKSNCLNNGLSFVYRRIEENTFHYYKLMPIVQKEDNNTYPLEPICIPQELWTQYKQHWSFK